MQLRHAWVAWPSDCGPLLPLNISYAGHDRRGKGTSGQAVALHWSGRRCAPTPLRCSVSWPRRRTHFAHCVRCVRTSATSQLTIRASRGATSPALLGAPEARPVLPERAFAGARALFATRTTSVAARQAVPGGGDFFGDEKVSPDTSGPADRLCLANGRASWPGAACKARPGVGVRSTLRRLTRRTCLNAVSEVSCATRPQGEHRSGVGAKRRPSQHEPPPGTAWRVAPKLHKSGRRRTAATGRKRARTDLPVVLARFGPARRVC